MNQASPTNAKAEAPHPKNRVRHTQKRIDDRKPKGKKLPPLEGAGSPNRPATHM